MNFIDKDLASVQESRILIEGAKEAKAILSELPQEKLDEIIRAVSQTAVGHLKEWAGLAVAETGCGCPEDEWKLMQQLLENLRDRFNTMQCVGILAENPKEGTLDIGVPLGIAVVLCPAQSPVAVVLNLVLACIKSGNAVIFIPHAETVNTVTEVIRILDEAAVAAGLPKGALTCLETVAESGGKAAISHSDVSVIVNIGMKTLLPDCHLTGKPVLYGSTGPSPVFIERTAKIKQAVTNIIASRSFNHGMMPAAEQYMIVDSSIAAEVKQAMIAGGAYFMADEQEHRLLELLCPAGREMDSGYIGRSAVWLAKRAGFYVPPETKVLVSEKMYIADRNPYSKELRCPVLACYIEPDWTRACEKCMNLLVQESRGQTLVIHSEDDDVIMQFALKKPVARMLVNTPAVQGALGMTTKLFPAMMLGGLTAQMGIMAENISPMNLIYIRKIGYGVRNPSEPDNNNIDTEVLKQLLKKVMSELANK